MQIRNPEPKPALSHGWFSRERLNERRIHSSTVSSFGSRDAPEDDM